jgi:hypothetical protein
LHPYILVTIYEVGDNYNFKTDTQGVKSKRTRKHTARYLLSEDKDGKRWVDDFLSKKALDIYTDLIPRAIREVDNGRNVLTVNITRGDSGRPVLNIYDASLATGTALPKKYTKK